ncbi:MAG: hypothetical protein ACE14V_05785 [bacterium]
MVDITFSDFLSKLEELGKNEWITVYERHYNGEENFSIYSALIANNIVEKSLNSTSFDLRTDVGLHVPKENNDEAKRINHQYPNIGVKAIAILRYFKGLKESYWEISEEFRHYFNLYEDKKNNKLILIGDNGDDEEVILISENKIQIKLRLIKKYLTVKKMHLALLFDIFRNSEKTIEELETEKCNKSIKGRDFIYNINIYPQESPKIMKSTGHLVGKKMISGWKEFKPKDDKYVDFIIGINEDGQEILCTCDEDKLVDDSGKNEGAPSEITPVFFKRDVLAKYYSQPDKYSVNDGSLECLGYWKLIIDNNHYKYIVVFLGELGGLPYKEQLYWQSFNVATQDSISRTAWLRNIAVQRVDPVKSDLYFKRKYRVLQQKWEERFGWKLFNPLKKGDEHCFQTLRIPLTNEQKEFDEQVLSLVKVLIDSLNEASLEKGLEIEEKDAQGLDKLEAFILSKGFKFDTRFRYLRKLQDLRSSSVAHRKGKKYEKIKKYFSIGEKDLSEVFDNILKECICTLNSLEHQFLDRTDISTT